MKNVMCTQQRKNCDTGEKKTYILSGRGAAEREENQRRRKGEAKTKTKNQNSPRKMREEPMEAQNRINEENDRISHR